VTTSSRIPASLRDRFDRLGVYWGREDNCMAGSRARCGIVAVAGGAACASFPSPLQPSVDALRDSDAGVRVRILGAIRLIVLKHRAAKRVQLNSWAVEAVLALLNDEDGKVRWQAIKTLGTLKDPRAVEPLLTSLRDVDVDARIAAIDALGDIGDLRALPTVQFTALPYRVSLAVGNTKPMSVPRRSPGGGLSAHTRPPCACTTALTMASPSPAPPAPRARRLPR